MNLEIIHEAKYMNEIQLKNMCVKQQFRYPHISEISLNLIVLQISITTVQLECLIANFEAVVGG